MDANLFSNNVGLVIDNLEGGYYHPNMLKDGRIKDSRYGGSGETMFGLDRQAGAGLFNNPAGQQFWSLIDNAGAKDNWKPNYPMGTSDINSPLMAQLKDLTAQIMLPTYTSLSNQWLSPQARAIVESDSRLLFNFIYATWNGAGWFKYFANKINSAVASGVTNADDLAKVVIDARTNQDAMKAYGWHADAASLISQGGGKVSSLFDRIKQSVGQDVTAAAQSFVDVTTKGVQTITQSPLLLIGGIIMIGFALFMTFEYFKTTDNLITQTT